MPSAAQFLDDNSAQSAAAFLDAPIAPSFGQNMINNAQSGLQSAENLVSPSYYSQSLEPAKDKLIAARKAGTAGLSDYVDAFMEGGFNSPVGQTMNAVGGASILNPVTTAVGNYVNPAIAKATGATPNEVAAAELFLPGLAKGVKAVVPESVASAITSAPGKVGDFIQRNTKDGSFLNDESSGAPPPPPAGASRAVVSDLTKQAYAAADAQGGTLAPTAVDAAINKAASVAPQTPEGITFAGENATTKAVNALQSLKGKPLSLAAYEEIDKDLTNRIAGETDITGKVSPDGKNLTEIRQNLRDATQNAAPGDLVGNSQGFDSYNQARQLAATGFRMRDVQQIFDKAENADNPQTVIKNGFSRLKSKGQGGFTDAEWADVDKASRTGLVAGTLKILGSRLISGIAGTAAGAAGGGVIGAPIGLMVGEALGYPLRKAGAALQSRPGNALMDKLGNRPVVQDALANSNAPPVDPQIANMRARVDAANAQPSIMDLLQQAFLDAKAKASNNSE